MRKLSKQQLRWADQNQIWHPFTQMLDYEKEIPLIIERAKGHYLWDIHGKKYLDGVSSLWVNVHGHRHPKIDHALIKQLKKMAHSTLLGLGSEAAIVLADKLLKKTPANLKHVFYSDSGSTAMEIALKIAYQFWQQQKNSKLRTKKHFLTFDGAYHGDTIGSVSLGRIDLFHQVYKPLLFKTQHGANLDTYRTVLKKKYFSLLEQMLSETEAKIKKFQNELAAVVIEPLMQGAAGMIKAPAGFLSQLRRLTSKYGVLLICDEVATGFGRTGTLFACEQEKVQPDLMAVAKGITGGYLPLAATFSTEEIYQAFKAPYQDQKTFFHGHSYTGNALACAAAIASLELFEKRNFWAQLQTKIEYLRKELVQLQELVWVGDIRQQGMMVGIELVQDRKNKTALPWEKKIGHQVILEARIRGVILRPLGNVIVLMPPLSIQIKEIRFLVKVVYESIQAVYKKTTLNHE